MKNVWNNISFMAGGFARLKTSQVPQSAWSIPILTRCPQFLIFGWHPKDLAKPISPDLPACGSGCKVPSGGPKDHVLATLVGPSARRIPKWRDWFKILPYDEISGFGCYRSKNPWKPRQNELMRGSRWGLQSRFWRDMRFKCWFIGCNAEIQNCITWMASFRSHVEWIG